MSYYSIRIDGYDYTRAGVYFVTMCTAQRASLFGDVVLGKMHLNSYGYIVRAEWERLPRHFPDARIDAYVIMPNHFHGLIIINPVGVGANRLVPDMKSDCQEPMQEQTVASNGGSPLRTRPNGPPSGSLGAIVGQFKSRVTKRIWAIPGAERTTIWQRNYYERIIREENELNAIRVYNQNNPLNWEKDQEYR
jgi:putative transposase